MARLMAVSILLVTVSALPVFLLGAASLEIGRELGFGAVGLGLLTGAFFLTAAASSAPLGRLIGRIGWPVAMRINLAASTLLSLAIAIAARNVMTLAMLLVLAGAVYGLANPAANQALADRVNPRRRALVFGLKHAGIPSSSLVAGLAVPVIVLTLGWRWAYVGAAVMGVVVLLMIPRGPVPPPTRSTPDIRRTVAPLNATMLSALALAASFATWAAIALSTYLVAASVDLGFSQAAGGLLLFGGSAASITARVTMGGLTDRIGGRGFAAIAMLTAIGALVFLAITVAGGPLFVVLVVVAFATGWGWPGLMTYAVVNANSGSAAASSAITQAGVFLGAGAGPVILGAAIDRWGFDAGWLLVAGALSVAAVGVSLVGKRALAAPSGIA